MLWCFDFVITRFFHRSTLFFVSSLFTYLHLHLLSKNDCNAIHTYISCSSSSAKRKCIDRESNPGLVDSSSWMATTNSTTRPSMPQGDVCSFVLINLVKYNINNHNFWLIKRFLRPRITCQPGAKS